MYSMKACASAAAGIEDNENGVCGGGKKKVTQMLHRRKERHGWVANSLM